MTLVSLLDAGAIFSGSAITKWLSENISGVRSEGDAQMLGQLLLESGLIFHSEGSRSFISSKSEWQLCMIWLIAACPIMSL